MFIVPPLGPTIQGGGSCRCMVSGALGKITDFHTFTSSFSNCAMRCVCVAPCCENIAAAAPKKNDLSIAARHQAVYIVSSGRASYHADCERRSLLSLRHPRWF